MASLVPDAVCAVEQSIKSPVSRPKVADMANSIVGAVMLQ